MTLASPVPKSIHDVRASHGLASFYWRFIRGFSTIMAAMNEVIKGTSFVWTPKAQSPFEEIVTRVTQALDIYQIMALKFS